MVTRRANREGIAVHVWQRGYYEQVIRSEEALASIRRYIIDNPAKWEDDEQNPRRRWPMRS